MTNPLTRKLELFGTLSEADRRLLDAVTSRTRSVEARTDLVREGEAPSDMYLIVEGLACRYKVLRDGRRSITAYLVPGDSSDFHASILTTMDHGIATLARCTVVDVSHGDALALSERPAIARALWWAALVDSATLRTWMVNVTRRDAESAIAHLFCELHFRMRLAGQASEGEFSLPVTQAELGDTVGLSTVHVNRSLTRLRDKGLVTFKGGRIAIPNTDQLAEACGFDPSYLHVGAGGSDRSPALDDAHAS